MIHHFHKMFTLLTFSLSGQLAINAHGETLSNNTNHLTQAVDEAVIPVMKEHDIAGMVIGVTHNGKRDYFRYGVASKDEKQSVTEHTIFEIGSISKTFTATLAAYVQAQGRISLSDSASLHWSALAGSVFDHITLLDLGTYTAGGLPLQFPDWVTNENMPTYYESWKPEYPPDTHRQYSNPSIGLLGYLTAQSMGENFDNLMETKLFPILGLKQTYIHVPQTQQANYAYGYTKEGTPIRVNPGVLDSEAYGVKTTAADMLRFIEININPKFTTPDEVLQEAIETTHTGYYAVGAMIQALGWEMYPSTVSLEQWIEGNSSTMALQAHPIEKLDIESLNQTPMLFNKTGSTNGFGAYVVFIPEKNWGMVILANKNYPNAQRVKLAHQVMEIYSQGFID